MQCDQFMDRMNGLLDERQDPLSDEEIVKHAHCCPECAELIASWDHVHHQLFAVSPAGEVAGTQLADQTSLATAFAERSLTPERQRIAAWLVLAAAVCWMVFTADRPDSPLESMPLQKEAPGLIADASDADFPFQDMDLRVREPRWWGEIAEATLRPVQPLAEGFRPLANSFQSAFQILTPRPAPPIQPSETPSNDFSAQRLLRLQRTA